MNRRPTRGTIRGRSSGSSAVSKRGRKYGGRRFYGPGVHLTHKHVNNKPTRVVVKIDEDPQVYVGPTVEGPDAEYIKVVSGKVDVRKPFFV